MNKSEIKSLQTKLNSVMGSNLVVDGDYGQNTTFAVSDFQRKYSLKNDGQAGPKTLAKLNEVYDKMHGKGADLLSFGKKRFVVFVDCGHGGVDDNGEYVTPGKRGYHPGASLHDGPNYYEGLENRIVGEAFIEACTDVGIQCIRLYHPYKDTKIGTRTEQVRSWLKRGYVGYMHSFHSNAISESKNTKEKLESTRGFIVFTTRDENFSDRIATEHFKNVEDTVGPNWTYRTQKQKDGDVDFEVNFQIMRETDLKEFVWFGSILDEWDFHTSRAGCEFIIESRQLRVLACLKTAIWVKKTLGEMRKKAGL